jgi:hypothetical protein
MGLAARIAFSSPRFSRFASSSHDGHIKIQLSPTITAAAVEGVLTYLYTDTVTVPKNHVTRRQMFSLARSWWLPELEAILQHTTLPPPLSHSPGKEGRGELTGVGLGGVGWGAFRGGSTRVGLARDLHALLDGSGGLAGGGGDVLLVAGGEVAGGDDGGAYKLAPKIRAHSLLLCLRCPFFETALHSAFSEGLSTSGVTVFRIGLERAVEEEEVSLLLQHYLQGGGGEEGGEEDRSWGLGGGAVRKRGKGEGDGKEEEAGGGEEESVFYRALQWQGLYRTLVYLYTGVCVLSVESSYLECVLMMRFADEFLLPVLYAYIHVTS